MGEVLGLKSAGGNNIGEGKLESYGPLDPEFIFLLILK